VRSGLGTLVGVWRCGTAGVATPGSDGLVGVVGRSGAVMSITSYLGAS
jgi:hypothetical protein